MPDASKLITVPVGRLGIIPMKSCEELGKKVDNYLVKWRKERSKPENTDLHFNGYERDTYIVKSECPRFASGEAKGTIKESVRGTDLYILVDVGNYSIEYNLSGRMVPMSPDDHYQDLKRVIAAAAGKANRINIIMPFLYESRQHKRTSRESLDCALALQELVQYGVTNIITFDAHDPRVQNAIPVSGFENIMPTYQFIKSLLRSTNDLTIDKDHLMVISPDEGAMHRAIYFANHFGVDVGMFYKRRDYSRVVNGKNPIVAHEFLGADVSGKDVVIIDDMISSGNGVIEIARQLKSRNARRIFICASFGLFTDGMEKFDEAYSQGLFSSILTTNLVYQRPELLAKPYYTGCDLSKFLALIIDTLNHDGSLSELLNPVDRITHFLIKNKNGETLFCSLSVFCYQ